MPELPDLVHIQRFLSREITGKRVASLTVRDPVVIRNATGELPEPLLRGKTIAAVTYRGPFLRMEISPGVELIINLMLAGSLQYRKRGEKSSGHLCVTVGFDDGTALNLRDPEKMAKVYLVPEGHHGVIPKYDHPGVDILSAEFTLERFLALAERHSRKQVRVLINDHTVLSSIGNAYADEVLFDAGIHPKTFVARLSRSDREALYNSIRQVMEWGIREVAEAGQPIDVKVRDHMKVRNRKGKACHRCGTTVRREGVRGHDVFFCPRCQPATRQHFIEWKNVP